jgi:HAD superfamily hydrolase (TIGR01509 family)
MFTPDPRPLAVAFDLDGLMFNTEELYTQVAAELVGRRGHELDMALIRRMMGRPARVGLPLMIARYELTDTVEALWRESDELLENLLPTGLAAMPGLLELLRLLDELQIPKAIATSSGRAYLERVLELANLPGEFAFYLTAEDVVDGKPAPEIYRKAAARFGIEPSAMLVLEDSENGCRAGVAAEALTVAVSAPHNQGCEYPGVFLHVQSLGDPRVRQLVTAARCRAPSVS